MGIWRIRISLADDMRSRERLNELLGGHLVQAVRLVPRPGGAAELDGDLLLELPRDDALGEMLAGLHSISRNVFVARADSINPAGAKQALVASG
jgi:hypothetical protein